MALFFVNPDPLNAVALIEELTQDGIEVQQELDFDSIIIWAQPEQIPILERICQKHSTELLNGPPPEWAKAMIKNGAAVLVVMLRGEASYFRKRWRDEEANT